MVDLVSLVGSDVVINTSSHAAGDYVLRLRGTIVERSPNAYKDCIFTVTVYTYDEVAVSPIEYTIGGQGTSNTVFTPFLLDPLATGGYISTYDLLDSGVSESHTWLSLTSNTQITITTTDEADAGAYVVDLRGTLDDSYSSSKQTIVDIYLLDIVPVV